jgi:PAS domain S-box-containing protein
MTRLTGTKHSFLLIISTLVFFWLLTALLFFDRWTHLLHFSAIRSEMADINKNFSHYKTSFIASDSPESSNMLFSIYSSLDLIENDFTLESDPVMKRKIRILRESLEEMDLNINNYLLLKEQTGNTRTGLLGRSLDIMHLLGSNKHNPVISEQYKNLLSFINYPNPEIPESIVNILELRRENIVRDLPSSISTPDGTITGSEVNGLFDDLLSNLKLLTEISRTIGDNGNIGIMTDIHSYSERFETVLGEMRESVSKTEKQFKSTMKAGILLWLIVFCSVFIYLLNSLSNSIFYRLSEIEGSTAKLSSGEIPEKINIVRNDEIGRIKANLNKLIHSLREKATFADSLAEGNFNNNLSADGQNDILANSLIKLSEKLSVAEKEEFHRKEEDKRRAWANEGIAMFGDIFRSEREDVKELSFKVVFNLVKYLNATAGAIYLVDQGSGKLEYELTSAFAWDRRKYLQKRILPGEGLVGVCALEKETMYISEVPDNYFEIYSGLIEMKPRCLLLVPLKLENEIPGVIEIASIKPFLDYEIKFVEQLGEITATTLAAVRVNERTSMLLEQSRKQTDEMVQKEESMRRNMEELKRSQEESQKKEVEISSILSAVNSSSLVAEYTITGRFADMNEKFQELFESPKDQISGKHHSDFAVNDKYSSEYKQFWRDLREGKTIQITEKYRLYSGTEIWLEETFSSVKDNEGKAYKIICIAHDITQIKNQQDAIEHQANEIKRRSIEMESLSNAVGNSMVQCELTAEGEIIHVNSIYIDTTGYSKKELIGKNIRIFLKDMEKDQFEKIWTEVTKDKVYSGAIRRTKPTGEEVWLMATFSPVSDEKGTIYKVYFLAQDITEKRLKYQLLEEANKEIDRLKAHAQSLEI